MAKKADSIAVPQSRDLSELDYDQIVALLDTGEVAHIQELDDRILFDKDSLVNTSFVITKVMFKAGDYPDPATGQTKEFAVVEVVTKDKGRGVFIDGSTGVCMQLSKFYEGRPIIVPAGLIRSDYTNEYGKGSTYYLSNQDTVK